MSSGKKVRYKNIIGGRIVAAVPIVVLQAVIIFTMLKWLAPFATFIYSGLSILSVLFVLYLVSKRDEGTYKILWIMVIFIAPLPGALAYLFYGNKRTGKRLERMLHSADKHMPMELEPGTDTMEELRGKNKRVAQTFEYVQNASGFPVVKNESATYYSIGEELFEQMKEALSQAKKYIFVEYFIVQEGVMWDSMVEIMERKAREGVDIRILYDDIGSLATFSLRNRETLLKKGFKCVNFNPLIGISGALNNRDHRKILVVDGVVAFSGGINLADEYINVKVKHGHWKDVGFRITGRAVESYTYMFVEFWNAFALDKITKDLLGEKNETFSDSSDGYVQPYYDSPIRKEALSNNLYIDLLGQATEHAWFYTPYLLLGDGLLDAFIHAARRGVDVRIIMPGVPDKELVYRMSRSYYRELLEAGVKIYEYTPGFVHAKACLIDDEIGTVGTVNLDYRSLYLHFECNALYYHASLLKDLKKDFINTISSSVERTMEQENTKFIYRLFDHVLRVFAPLV